MEGASLPVLTMPQPLTAAGGAASPATAGGAAGDGFAAILGATELTGLTAEQRAALGQLLAKPVETLQPVIDLGGKVLPQAAIRGLLEVLGVEVDVAELGAGVPADAAAELTPTGPVEAPDGHSDLVALLTALWLAMPSRAPQRLVARSPGDTDDIPAPAASSLAPAPFEAATAGGAIGAESVATPSCPAMRRPGMVGDATRLLAERGSLMATEDPGSAVNASLRSSAADNDVGPTLSTPGPLPPLSIGVPVAASATSGDAQAAVPAAFQPLASVGTRGRLFHQPATLADLASFAAASPGVSPSAEAAPVAPGSPSAAGAPSPGLPTPAAVLAAVESLIEEPHAAVPPVPDFARDLASASDATTPGRSAVAALAELVPPRAARGLPEAVSIPVGERGWERAFGERVVWLVGQQIQAAEVRLNPPHLGPVEVRLSLTGQDASVSFTVSHGATRDAIEQAIPRLRELFAEHQLQIVNVDVGQRDAAGQASQGERWSGAGGPHPAPETATRETTEPEPPARARRGALPGLVDEYV